MNPCENCIATKAIHDSLGCSSDCLHNAFEMLKAEIAKAFRMNYEPKFQCRLFVAKGDTEQYYDQL